MIAELTLVAAFLVGLAGSTHCLGMCGGIAGSLGAGIGDSSPHRRWLMALSFNLGRIISYAILGALVALLVFAIGHGIAAPQWGMFLRLLTGAIFIAIACQLLLGWQGLRRIETLGGRVWPHVAPLARRLMPVRSPLQALALGGLWGWLPCGLVYTALLAAAGSGQPLQGAAIMLSFGLGTLPAMTGVTLFGQAIRRWRTGIGGRQLTGLLLLAFGLWTVATPAMHMVSGEHHGHAMPHGHDTTSNDHWPGVDP